MSQRNINLNLNEALNAYEASDFLRAESLSRQVLQQGYNEAHCCADFTKALFLAAKSHAKLESNEEIISELVSTGPVERNCILSHTFPEDIEPFYGTAKGFTSMSRRRQQQQQSSLPDASTSLKFTDNLSIFLFLCGLCLDYGLYSCALNLALQLHSVASEHQKATIPDEADGFTMDGDLLPLDLPPVGLTRELWLRVVECCHGLTPVVASQSTLMSARNEQHTEGNSANRGRAGKETQMTVNGSNGLSADPSEQAHFTCVHEFSVKEEQLRAHTHAIHEARRNSKDYTSHLTPSFSQSNERYSEASKDKCQVNGDTDGESNLLDLYSLDTAICQRANEDYLPGLGAAAMGPWAPRFSRSTQSSNTNALTTDVVGSVSLGPGVLDEKHETESHRAASGAVDVRPKLATELDVSMRNTSDAHRCWSDDADGDGDDEFDDNNDDGSVNGDADSDKDDDEADGTEMNGMRSPSLPQAQLIRRVSILRSPTVNADGEMTKSPPKHVRFSLDSTHPSPAMEAEYGGRSNRRRLIDFARRRQLLSHQSTSDFPHHSVVDGTYNLHYFLLQMNYSLLYGLKWCWYKFSHILCALFRIQFSLLVSVCLLVWFVTGFVLLFCSSALHLPLGQLWLPLNESAGRILEPTETLDRSERVCVWIFRWLTDYLPRMAIT